MNKIMNIYIAGPFLQDHERKALLHMIELVKKCYPDADLYIPMNFKVEGDYQKEDGSWFLPNKEWAHRVYLSDKNAIDNADLMVAMYVGHICTSGTTWEIGYAVGKGIPVVGWIPEYVIGNVSLMVMNGFSKRITEEGMIVPITEEYLSQFNQK